MTSGQGCGHNLFGAGSVGAAIALKRTMEKHGIQGTVKLFGTPAEETVVGKVYMAKAGVFDGLDGVLDWHPSQETGVRNQPGRALNNFTVEYFGQAAHGAADQVGHHAEDLRCGVQVDVLARPKRRDQLLVAAQVGQHAQLDLGVIR